MENQILGTALKYMSSNQTGESVFQTEKGKS